MAVAGGAIANDAGEIARAFDPRTASNRSGPMTKALKITATQSRFAGSWAA
jgi:hypothetical protein